MKLWSYLNSAYLLDIFARNVVFQLPIANYPKIWSFKTLVIYYPSFSVDQELRIQLSDLVSWSLICSRGLEGAETELAQRGPGQGVIPPVSGPCHVVPMS